MQLHAEPVGDRLGLVHAARPQASDVELLQRHDVRLAGGDHRRDAAGVEHAVDPRQRWTL